MKRFFIALTFAVFLALFSAPSTVKAESVIGEVIIYDSLNPYRSDVLCSQVPTSIRDNGGIWYPYLYFYNRNGVESTLYVYDTYAMYIPSLEQSVTVYYGGREITAFNDYTEYLYAIPEQFWPEGFPPEPSWLDGVWDYLYELYYDIFGIYPLPGSLLDWLADPDTREDDFVFPTNIPTPTPTPAPTPIPVQTIYVPDGNGGFTIIYQYPDANGNPTQSPVNPNLNYELTVNCDCGGDSDSDKDRNKQDPYYAPIDYFSWGSVDGDFTDSPAYTAGQSLDMIKSSVEDSSADMKVVSNSFGFLPPKWLTLVGLLGAVLIVAGLIRTFLGG